MSHDPESGAMQTGDSGTGELQNGRRDAFEHALAAIEQKLRMVLQNIREIVYMADREGFITYINETVSRYGYTPEELIGANILDIVCPDDRERASRHLRERRTGERRTSAYAVRILPKNDGNPANNPVVSLTAEGYYSGAGDNRAFLGTIGIVNEITAGAADIQPKLPLDIEAVEPHDAVPPRVRIEISDPANDGRVELLCSLLDIRALHHMVSVCSNCKRIRNEHGIWEDFEDYLSRRFHIDFSHGICSDCERDLYDNFLKRGDDG